ncbi:hypothetical protein RHGRI_023939 [Rhododendron griersonianum]|uniref:cysteine dioxygenase n=1 Tax=Rhododendron griersonianum TaxID=479676 RepID=A0AAV6JCP6_9ERIC|nr:hypothetical protein RHGRI_023939 [Rhododendron griersonianum]
MLPLPRLEGSKVPKHFFFFAKFIQNISNIWKSIIVIPHQIKRRFVVCMYRGLVTMTKKAFPSSSSSSSVQELYDLCKMTFTPSGTSPASPQAIQKLCSLLDTIRPADIGLKEEDQGDDGGHGLFGLPRFNRVGRWAQPITYVDVHECDSFTVSSFIWLLSFNYYDRLVQFGGSRMRDTFLYRVMILIQLDGYLFLFLSVQMCIFCFPTSSVIPLHDHPGMTVLSKVLYGSLHVKAYDWVEPEKMQRSMGPNDSPVRLVKLTVDKVLTAPCGTSVLYPNRGGNVHCFTAITSCAVLDILTPPYQEAAGRKCTYYHDYPYSSFTTGKGEELNDGNEEDYAWLAQIGTPDDLYMRSGEYQGPVIKV